MSVEGLSESQRRQAGFMMDLARWQVLGESLPPHESIGQDWGELLRLANKHKMERIFARFLIVSGSGTPALQLLSQDILDSSRKRAERNAAAMRELQRALADRSIPSLLRKGIVYGRLFYDDWALRRQNDNDMFVPPDKREQAADLLSEQGFAFGKWSYRTHSVEPLPRSEAMMFRLMPDHLPHAFKVIGEPFAEYIKVDVSLNLTWFDSPFLEAEQLLAPEFESPAHVEGLATLSRHGHFFDCLFHNYREGYFSNAIILGGDNLRKFVDLWLIWIAMDEGDRAAVRRDIAAFGLEPVAGWVCVHMDELFGTKMAAGLGLDGYERARAFRWRNARGDELDWKGSMWDRLFAPDPMALFPGIGQRG